MPNDSTSGSCPSCGRDLTAATSGWRRHLPLWLALFGPALGTMLIALAKSDTLTSGWVLTASPIGGLVAGILLSRVMVRNPAGRVVAALVLIPLLAFFCLVSSFFGCAMAGGGGVRLGG